jgi:hypothetical protein
MRERTEFVTLSGSEQEIWKPVPGYSDYEVSSHGRVRRCEAVGRWPAGHALRPGQSRSGHLYVMLTGPDRRARKQFVHRLVAKAFLGAPPFEGAMVLHHDDHPTNNRPANLYWGDQRQNARDAKLNRKLPAEVSQRGAQEGSANSSAVLCEDDVRQILQHLDMGLCGACIARLYGVRKETIYAIAKGRTWWHLQRPAA